MCRILGAIGVPLPLDQLLLTPPFSLRNQARWPRHQDVGRINADGWGVGWYDLAVRPEPARYRTATPMWADLRFPDFAPMLTSDLVIAAVRNASPGAPVEETGNSPFVAEQHLFTHNGYIDGYRDGLGVQMRRGLSEKRDAQVLGAADSEVLFAMVLDRLDKGASMTDAITDVLGEMHELTTGRYNLLLADGHTLVATRDGNSLFTLTDPGGGHLIASEPYDDDPRWLAVPDRSLIVAAPGAALVISPL